ncbi:MAG: hypothetical protein R2800_05130 [Flavipsychrobacter sp.]
MKKSILFVAALLAIGFTSCKKDYTCECKETSTGTILSSRTINNTKALAKTECETSNVVSSSVGVSCNIK